MAFDVQTLAELAKCGDCLSPNQKQNVLLYLLNGILENGAGGGGLHNLLSLTHPDTVPGPPTRGALVVGNATPDWEALPIGAANRVLRSDGVDATWAQLVLTTDVTGILPIANGGTNSSAALANNRIMVSNGGAIVEAAALTNGQLLIGSTGAAPVAASLTAGANITITPGAGSITIASTIGTHTILDAAVHTDSVTQAVTRGSLIYGNSTPKWDELAIGAAGRFLGSDGTDVSWTVLPGSFTGFDNPTAQVGLVVVNGVATTAMRSDAAPALSQAIVPTWTGAHTWNPAANTTPITVSLFSLTGANTQSVLDLSGTWNTSGAPSGIKLNITNTASSASSLLLNLQTGSDTRFSVRKDAFIEATRREADNSYLQLILRKRGTTGDADGAIASGAGMALINFQGWTGVSYAEGASIRVFPKEAWTATTLGTSFSFYVAPTGGVATVNVVDISTDSVLLKNGPGLIVRNVRNAVQIDPYGVAAGNTSEIRFLELAASGTNYAGFKAADAMAASEIYVLPNAAPSASRFLQAAAVAGGVSALSWAQVSLTADVAGILPVANGGSGTGTAFTAGSVIFAGVAGIYTEDNANFFWDDAANRLTVNQLNISNTSSATVGGIYFGTDRTIHNFGTDNLFIGRASGNLTLTGINNTSIGGLTLQLVTTGQNNVAIGFRALQANTSGLMNNAIGSNALIANTTGSNNTAVGFALVSNTTGGNNAGIGFQALNGNTVANNNVGIGTSALTTNSTGNNNTAIGYQALFGNTTADDNVAIGINAMLSNTTGASNTAIGSASMFLNLTGGSNTAIGYRALFSITSSNNTGIGYRAGDNLTSGANNIVIGYDVDSPTATNSNTLVIGNLLFGTGLDAIGTTLASGNIGIGVITPLAKFHVTNSAAATVCSIFKAAAAQSANLTEWQDSSAVILTKVNSVGNVGVRMAATALTAYLHLAAGTTAASTAPLKFTTGTSMTTAEAGAMEFTTDDLFFTITTGAARKRLLMADATAGLTATRVPFATTNGRLTDDAAMTFATAILTVPSLTIGAAGVLKLGNAAVAATPTPTHTVTIQDSTGTTYRVPVVV